MRFGFVGYTQARQPIQQLYHGYRLTGRGVSVTMQVRLI